VAKTIFYIRYKEIFMAKKIAKIADKTVEKPKRLSKAGEWRLKHPNGLGGRILDMKAVMR
jgi:hypothetical protein